jgi:hypothetical protein
VARFKWSRDNAAFAVGIKAVSADRRTLTLTSLGRDQATALRQGDLVEVCDDASELGPARGHLTHLSADPDPDQFTVGITHPLPPSFVVGGGTVPQTSPPSPANGSPPTRHPILRRWDGQGTTNVTFSETATPDMNLGDGVHTQFGGTNLQSGDYWQFAARSADGSVEALTNAPPMGIVRHRCPLAIVQWSLPTVQSPPSSPPSSPPGGPNAHTLRVIEDCRKVFPPLVDFPRTEAGMQVTQVFTGDPATGRAIPLFNDSNVLVTRLFSGITVLCDTDVDPTAISAPTCFLSVELPSVGTDETAPGSPPAVQLIGYQSLTLAGTVSATGNAIRWVPGAGAAAALPGMAALKPTVDRGILTRLTLKGNFIWAANNPALFLDGEAFGQPQEGITLLSLPSGDRRRGGDFEMWFWLIARPVTVIDLQLNPGVIFVGDAAVGTVTLSDPAPSGGAVVALANSNTAAATVPATVTVEAGSQSGTFSVTGNVPGGQTTITATLGEVSRADTLTVISRPINLTGLQFNPSAIRVGTTATGTITLNAAAPAGGVVVALANSNPDVAGVPSSVDISAGSAQATFIATGIAVGQTVVTATFAGNSLQAPLFVREFKTFEKDPKEFEKEPKEFDKLRPKEFDKLAPKEFDVPLKTFEVGGGILRSAGNPHSTSAISSAGGDDLEVSAPTRRPFINSDERPTVGEAILNQPDHEEQG